MESVFIIKPHDCRTRWRVRSQENPEIEYVVDVMAYHKTGRCTCSDFTMRKEPIARLVYEAMDSLRCKHLRAVRDRLLDALLDEIAEPVHQRIENE